MIHEKKTFNAKELRELSSTIDIVIENHEFHGCTFDGPISFLFIGDCNICNNSFDKFGQVFIIKDKEVNICASGLIVMRNCTIDNCELKDASFFISGKHLSKLKDNAFDRFLCVSNYE